MGSAVVSTDTLSWRDILVARLMTRYTHQELGFMVCGRL